MLLTQSPALFLAWLAWCLLHSLLASRRVKGRLELRLHLTRRHYRLAYVIFSTLSVTALFFWQLAVLPPPPPAGWPWQAVRFLLGGYGLLMLWAGGRAYDLREFLGLKVFTTSSAGHPHMQKGGILAWVRHPWYSGGIALVAAVGETPLDRWDWRLLLIAYLVIGCLVEERRLTDELGEVYRQYQREVPMLLPRIIPGTARNGEADQ